MSDLKKDTERFLRDGIPDTEVLELRELATTIKNVNRKYSTGILSPVSVTKLTKIDILRNLELKNREIDELIRKSPVEVFYKLDNLYCFLLGKIC